MTASAKEAPPPPLGNAFRVFIVGFAMLCGSVSLIYPFGRDQGAYAYAGWVMLEGGAPYRDVFIFKPPMTAIVHGLAIGLFGVNTWAIRVLDLGWTAATALVVAAIALELWHRRDAALAAGLACPFLYYQIDYWTIAQTDGWMTLPCAAAMWAVLRGGRALGQGTRSATGWWIAAGMLAGVAVLFKYTAITIGLPMLAALGWVGATHGRQARIGLLAMIFGGALTLSACAIWLVVAGAWAPFVDSQLDLLPSYVERRSDANSATQAFARLVTLKRTKLDLIPLFWAAPVALVPALSSVRRSGRPAWLGLGVVVIWWFTALSNVVVQGKFFDYHYLPMLAPAALIAGLGLAVVLRRPLSWLHRRELRALSLVALLVLLIAATPLGGRVRELGRVTLGGQSIEEYIASRREYSFPGYNVGEIRRVSKLLQDTTTPDQRVFLWGYEPTINVRARRHTVSRFLYNFPFRVSWGDPGYQSELMHALLARPPDVFVVSSGDRFPGLTGTYKDSAALLRDFEELDVFVKERYEPAETVGRYSLWRLHKRVERPGSPNIILISVDTLRPDHLGAYDNTTAKTPHIDSLATEGTTFVHAFAPMGRTTPSLASMMTGLWPHQHGSREVRAPITHGTLLTSLLKEAGYATAGVTANAVADRDEGFAVGFDAFTEVHENDRAADWDAEGVTNRALALVHDAPGDKPLFLWAHYVDPHWPYDQPGTSNHGAATPCSELLQLERGARESNLGGQSERALPACRDAYDAEVAFTDAQIGRLLAGLRNEGRRDNAIVLFTSDHGENFGERGLYYAHGPNVHDASLRIPLIITGPGIEKGATRLDVARLIDVAPTVLSLANIPKATWPSMKGVDLTGTLQEGPGTGAEPPLAFAESGGTLVRGNHTHLLSGRPRTGYCINRDQYSLCWKDDVAPALYDRERDLKMTNDLRHEKPHLYAEMLGARARWTPGKTRERSVRGRRFKLVERPRFEGGYSRSLYDMSKDPAEAIDVQKEYPEDFQKLVQALATWTANVPGYVQIELSDEAEAQLKALGYIE